MKLTKERIAFFAQFFSYMRPEGGAGQQWFEARYIDTLPDTWKDAAGNTHLDLRTATTHRTLFVAHTDTVHHLDGRQQPTITGALMTCTLADTKATCLGADDGAGVAVLLHLIHNRVPAYYIFTRGEERGGIGAQCLVAHHAPRLAEFDRAIAFDRKGTSSVISHQGWGRCCSDTFADALSEQLSSDWLMYAPDAGGVYTDTAEFVGIIPECTNISVGYTHEHTTKETLDLQHLVDLMEQAVSIDWDALPVERVPTDAADYANYTNNYTQYTTQYTAERTPANYDWWESAEEYNNTAFEAVCDAEDGRVQDLMWLTAEAVMPEDAEVIYARIQNGRPSRHILKALRRDIDRAYDSIDLTVALNMFYTALLDEQDLTTTCEPFAH